MNRTALAGLAAAATSLLTACGGGGPIEENVVRPGITAMDEAATLACGTDESTLVTAIEAYTALNGEPPADEAALIAAGLLREESESWDIVDGRLVPAQSSCGVEPPSTTAAIGAPLTAPASEVGEIVTDTQPPLTADEMLAALTDADIAQVGGIECARELTLIFAAAERYVAEQDAEPETLDDLFGAGYLDAPITLWQVEADQLVPTAGSGCISPDADRTASCAAEATTLAVAREAYLASSPDAGEPTEAELVAAGLLREEFDALDLVDGTVVAVPGSTCEGVDLDP